MNVESIDLAELTAQLRAACGAFVEGTLVGRTRLRDEVARRYGCSLLEAEQLIDTMVMRGFIVEDARASLGGWSLREVR